MSYPALQQNMLENVYYDFREYVDTRQYHNAGEIIRSLRSAGYSREADALQKELVERVQGLGSDIQMSSWTTTK